MTHILEMLLQLNDEQAYGQLFCTVLLFKTRYELLVGEVEAVLNKEDVHEGEEAQRQRTTVFEVEAIVLHNFHAAGIYQHRH